MSTLGYIYVLINPSLDGLVKIGKTTRSPENRVNELSSATGVPTPFQLVYWAEFEDCDSAERVLHNVFTERGVRVSDNREFFRIKPHEVIPVILTLQQGMSPLEHKTHLTQHEDESSQINNASLIESLVTDAKAHLTGGAGKFQDVSKSIAIFKKAFNLGSVEACLNLGVIYRDNDNVKNLQKSKEYLLHGIERGALASHAELGITFSLLNEISNSEIAWEQFLESASKLDESSRGKYCACCAKGIAQLGLDIKLLILLRPFANDVLLFLRKQLSIFTSQNDTSSLKDILCDIEVAQYLLLDILPAQLGGQNGRIRYINKQHDSERGGWITGDDGKEYEFTNTFGLPALQGRFVSFNGIFSYANNYGKADNVFVHRP